PPERGFYVRRRLLELAPQDGQVFARLRACVLECAAKLCDYLPPRLCERERLVSRRVLVRASGGVEIEEQRNDGDDRRDHCKGGADERGHDSPDPIPADPTVRARRPAFRGSCRPRSGLTSLPGSPRPQEPTPGPRRASLSTVERNRTRQAVTDTVKVPANRLNQSRRQPAAGELSLPNGCCATKTRCPAKTSACGCPTATTLHASGKEWALAAIGCVTLAGTLLVAILPWS